MGTPDGGPAAVRRRESQRRLDDLDQCLQAIDARLRDLDCKDEGDEGEVERLSARRHELAVEAAGCFDELDYLDDPEEYLEDMGRGGRWDRSAGPRGRSPPTGRSRSRAVT